MLCQHVMDTKDSATFTDALNCSDLLSCQCTRGLKLGGLEERSSKSTNPLSQYSPHSAPSGNASSNVSLLPAAMVGQPHPESCTWGPFCYPSAASSTCRVYPDCYSSCPLDLPCCSSFPIQPCTSHCMCVCMCVLQCECVFLFRLKLRAPANFFHINFL